MSPPISTTVLATDSASGCHRLWAPPCLCHAVLSTPGNHHARRCEIVPPFPASICHSPHHSAAAVPPTPSHSTPNNFPQTQHRCRGQLRANRMTNWPRLTCCPRCHPYRLYHWDELAEPMSTHSFDCLAGKVSGKPLDCCLKTVRNCKKIAENRWKIGFAEIHWIFLRIHRLEPDQTLDAIGCQIQVSS